MEDIKPATDRHNGLIFAWINLFIYFAAPVLYVGIVQAALYIPNYILAISTPGTATRNLSIQALVTPISSTAPAIHGALTDMYGFRASFAFGIATAIVSLLFFLPLPSDPVRADAASKPAAEPEP